MVWQVVRMDMGNAVLRPFVMIRLMSDDELANSQVAPSMYGLHNPEAGLPCISCKIFTKFGDVAGPLDRMVKDEHETIIKCPHCASLHVLTTKGTMPGWVILARPL